MQRRFNVIDRGTPRVQGNSKVRESLPYVGFVRPSESVTEEQAKQINSERYTQARETYEAMKKDGYSPTLEGYLKDGSFVSTHDAHKLCKVSVKKPDDHEALLVVQEVLQVVMNNVPRHTGRNLDGLKTARLYLQEIEKELQIQIQRLEERMWNVAATQQGLFESPK